MPQVYAPKPVELVYATLSDIELPPCAPQHSIFAKVVFGNEICCTLPVYSYNKKRKTEKSQQIIQESPQTHSKSILKD
jgi:hypothetical protein